jgi:hypothetical protein
MWRVRLWLFHFFFKDIVRCRECKQCVDVPPGEITSFSVVYTKCTYYGDVVDGSALKWCVRFRSKRKA